MNRNTPYLLGNKQDGGASNLHKRLTSSATTTSTSDDSGKKQQQQREREHSLVTMTSINNSSGTGSSRASSRSTKQSAGGMFTTLLQSTAERVSNYIGSSSSNGNTSYKSKKMTAAIKKKQQRQRQRYKRDASMDSETDTTNNDPTEEDEDDIEEDDEVRAIREIKEGDGPFSFSSDKQIETMTKSNVARILILIVMIAVAIINSTLVEMRVNWMLFYLLIPIVMEFVQQPLQDVSELTYLIFIILEAIGIIVTSGLAIYFGWFLYICAFYNGCVNTDSTAVGLFISLLIVIPMWAYTIRMFLGSLKQFIRYNETRKMDELKEEYATYGIVKVDDSSNSNNNSSLSNVVVDA